MMRNTLITLVAVGLLAGCGPEVDPKAGTKQQPVKAFEAASPLDLFPVSEGNAWTYTIEVRVTAPNGEVINRRMSEQSYKVVSVNDTPEGKRARVHILAEDGTKLAEMGLLFTDKGLFQTGFTSETITINHDPIQPIFFWPLKADETHKYSGISYLPGLRRSGPISGEMVYKGEYEVDTASGRYKALRVDYTQEYKHEGKDYVSVLVSWFTPKVGPVKMNEFIALQNNASQLTIMSLKSYTVK